MSWIYCAKCLTFTKQPSYQSMVGNPGVNDPHNDQVKMFTTTCGHIFCEKCIRICVPSCLMCRKKCRTMEINRNLPTKISFFFDPLHITLDKLHKSAEFQLRHVCHFIRWESPLLKKIQKARECYEMHVVEVKRMENYVNRYRQYVMGLMKLSMQVKKNNNNRTSFNSNNRLSTQGQRATPSTAAIEYPRSGRFNGPDYLRTSMNNNFNLSQSTRSLEASKYHDDSGLGRSSTSKQSMDNVRPLYKKSARFKTFF